MLLTFEDLRAVELAELAAHDSVVKVTGGSRFKRDGKSIRPFGAQLAADVLGTTADVVRNMLDPTKEHVMSIAKYHKLLLAGADPVWLEEVARSLGGVVLWMPEVSGHDNITEDLLKAVKEFGDLGKEMGEILADGKVTAKELNRFERETDEAITAILALREDLKAMVQK